MLNPTEFLSKNGLLIRNSVNNQNSPNLFNRIQLFPVITLKIALVAMNVNPIWFLIQKNRVDIHTLIELNLIEIQIDQMDEIGHNVFGEGFFIVVVAFKVDYLIIQDDRIRRLIPG